MLAVYGMDQEKNTQIILQPVLSIQMLHCYDGSKRFPIESNCSSSSFWNKNPGQMLFDMCSLKFHTAIIPRHLRHGKSLSCSIRKRELLKSAIHILPMGQKMEGLKRKL